MAIIPAKVLYFIIVSETSFHRVIQFSILQVGKFVELRVDAYFACISDSVAIIVSICGINPRMIFLATSHTIK